MRLQNADNFPTGVLPEVIRDAVLEACDLSGAPVSMAAGLALSALAAACQRRYEVRSPAGFVSPTSLFIIHIAKSGERKTTVEGLFLQGIRQLDAERKKEFLVELRKCELEKAIWKAEVEGLKKSIVAAARSGKDVEGASGRLRVAYEKEPILPVEQTILYSDTTPEALLARLSGGSASALLQSSEGALVFGRLRASALASLNALWDGNPFSVERRVGKSFSTADARLSVSLMTQVGVMRNFHSRGGGQARDIGFLARCLVSAPLSTQGYREVSLSGMKSGRGLELFNELTREILRQGCDRTPDTNGRVIELDSEAKGVWQDFSGRVERGLREEADFGDVSDSASKIVDNTCRIAAILHVLQGDRCALIDATTFQAAASICEWYLWEFKRLFGRSSELSEDFEDSKLLLRQVVDGFTDSEGVLGVDLKCVRSACSTFIDSQKRVDAAIRRLHHPRFFYVREIGRRRIVFFERRRLLDLY